MDSELWEGAIGAALGAHAGSRIWTDDRWVLSLAGGIAWGIGSDQGVHALDFRAVLQVDHLLFSSVAIGFGVAVRLLHANVDGASAQGGSAGVVVTARYRALVGKAFSVYAGPMLEALAQPLVVQVNEEESFQVPRFVAGFSVEGAADFGL